MELEYHCIVFYSGLVNRAEINYLQKTADIIFLRIVHIVTPGRLFDKSALFLTIVSSNSINFVIVIDNDDGGDDDIYIMMQCLFVCHEK